MSSKMDPHCPGEKRNTKKDKRRNKKKHPYKKGGRGRTLEIFKLH